MDKLVAKDDGSALRITLPLPPALKFIDWASTHVVPVVALRLHQRMA